MGRKLGSRDGLGDSRLSLGSPAAQFLAPRLWLEPLLDKGRGTTSRGTGGELGRGQGREDGPVFSGQDPREAPGWSPHLPLT